MTTSRKGFSLSDITEDDRIPAGTLAYFHSRTRNNIYDFIISKFLERERAGKLTRAQLARRIRKNPAVVSRLLGAPGNWTIETISDLLIGIAAEELAMGSASISGRERRNFSASDLAKGERDIVRPTKTSSDAATLAYPDVIGTAQRQTENFHVNFDG